MLPRFYAPDVHGEGQIAPLPSDEASHFARVLRGRPGASIRVFDGRGNEFSATVRDARRDAVTIEVGERIAPAPERRVSITLAQAMLKSDKMDDVVRDAVMMGVAAIQPIVSARSESTVAAAERAGRRERWVRIAVASAKQCGRAVVPDVHPVLTFDAAADRYAGDESRMTLHFVEPGAHGTDAASVAQSVAAISIPELPRPADGAGVVLLTGPEGGWTSEEIARTRGACRHLTMQGPTLRADSMAVVAIAALLGAWGDL